VSSRQLVQSIEKRVSQMLSSRKVDTCSAVVVDRRLRPCCRSSIMSRRYDDDQWRSQKFSTGGASVSASDSFSRFWRYINLYVCMYVTFLSVHSRSAALPSRPYDQKMSWHIIPLGFTRRPITLRNHIPRTYVFSWQGVHTPLTPLVWLRHCRRQRIPYLDV